MLYPPVDTARFTPGVVGDHYLVVSALLSHKRIDVAVEAFTRLGLPLVVVGDGPDARRLERMAGPTVRFAGRLSDERTAELMSSARALVVTATEEFGIAAVEAQAAGRPVIAIDEGGARETVIEGETGTLWSPREADALIEAVRGFDPMAIDPAACVRNARRFDVERFGTGLRAIVAEALEGDRAPKHPRRTLPRTRRRTRPAA